MQWGKKCTIIKKKQKIIVFNFWQGVISVIYLVLRDALPYVCTQNDSKIY